MVDVPLPLSQSLLSVMCSGGGALYSGRHVVDTRPLPLSQSLLSVMCSGGQEPCILEDMWWIRGLYPYHNLY